MTVISNSFAYPGGNKITIVSWFKTIDLSGNDGGVAVGAGYDPNSNDVPSGGMSDNDETLMSFGGSLIPLCEWGYSTNTSSGPQTGDKWSGPQQTVSGLYLDPPRGAKTLGSEIFVARGPFFNTQGFPCTSFPNAAGPQLIDEGGVDGTMYATVSTILHGFNAATSIDRSTWVNNQWNVLILSADLSPLDQLIGGSYLGFVSPLQHYRVNKKIWANCNGEVDTLGGGSPSGFEQGYPYPGGNAISRGFYRIQESPLPQDNNPLAFILVDPVQPALSMPAGEFHVPCREPWASPQYNYAKVVFGTTQVWFNRYIEPTSDNFSKFYRTQDGKLYPRGGKVAADFFGTPDVWLERDNVSGIKFEENQGTAGEFDLVGTDPEDLKPGPEEGIEIIA